MKLALALAAPVLLLAGAAVAQGDGGGRVYRATGRMPDWTLQIDRGTIRYFGDNGRTRVVVPAPVARPSFNGMRYVTPRITVDLTYAPCRDGRSGNVYHDRVTVTVGLRTVRGCGGDRLVTPSTLADTRWTIVRVDGRPVQAARPTSIRFSGSRIEGNAGCNSFGGDYRLDGDRLTADRVISTRMACPGAGMDVERSFFEAIAAARISGDRETLTLRSPQTVIELRRTN